jgi:hypothetical protein
MNMHKIQFTIHGIKQQSINYFIYCTVQLTLSEPSIFELKHIYDQNILHVVLNGKDSLDYI